MGEIFEFIFENMFLVILIISGIIGMLSSNKEQQKKQQQQRPNRPQQPQTGRQGQPRQAPASTRKETVRERPKEVVTTKIEPEPKEATVTLATPKGMEEEQQAQIDRLQERYRGAADVNTTDGNIDDFISRQQMEVLKSLSEEQEVLKKDIRRSLKNKGLINGIIMAEVLGRPRSLKPYQSVTSERYKR
ncbi:MULTISPECIES: hypothetical protein [unclassified Oceanobacillus]|uniref:hypothetical protein n=1 Tax=unclassified Oceanobacillus TaxID=2630292 RepID=UPI00300DEAE0